MSALPDAPMPPAGRMQRARGVARVGFRRHDDGVTRLSDLFQDGCGKVLRPKVYDGGGPVAVLLNTAGGVTGGDRLDYAAAFGPGARAMVTTQAAERIYRRAEGVATIATTLTLGACAQALWLPQETIVFDRAALTRTLTVEMAGDAVFTGCEAVVLGRTAMGEAVRETALRDRWRLRRDGRLAFADDFRLVGDAAAILAGTATGAGAAAFATLVHAAPSAEARIDGLRGLIDSVAGVGQDGVTAGASAFDGLLVLRMIARDGRALRDALMPLAAWLAGRALPRVWSV